MTRTRVGHQEILSLVIAAIALALGGCCCSKHAHHGNGRGPGLVAKSDGVQVTPITLSSELGPVTARVAAGESALRLSVTSRDHAYKNDQGEVHGDFTVFFEPEGANDEARTAKVNFQSPSDVFFGSGWSLFTGKAPIGKTRRVRAVGNGTTFIIQIGDDHDTIYMIDEGDPAQYVAVQAIQADDTYVDCDRIRAGQYMRVTDERDAAGTLVARKCDRPRDVVAGSAEAVFIQQALQKAGDQP